MAADAERLRLRSGAAAWFAEDGETVLLDLDKGTYVGVNRSGTLLWGALADGATRSELVTLLRETYGLPQARAVEDVDEFVRSCRTRGFLDA